MTPGWPCSPLLISQAPSGDSVRPWAQQRCPEQHRICEAGGQGGALSVTMPIGQSSRNPLHDYRDYPLSARLNPPPKNQKKSRWSDAASYLRKYSAIHRGCAVPSTHAAAIRCSPSWEQQTSPTEHTKPKNPKKTHTRKHAPSWMAPASYEQRVYCALNPQQREPASQQTAATQGRVCLGGRNILKGAARIGGARE